MEVPSYTYKRSRAIPHWTSLLLEAAFEVGATLAADVLDHAQSLQDKTSS